YRLVWLLQRLGPYEARPGGVHAGLIAPRGAARTGPPLRHRDRPAPRHALSQPQPARAHGGRNPIPQLESLKTREPAQQTGRVLFWRSKADSLTFEPGRH